MTDTTIYLGSFAIHEPVTAFTDYIITCIGFLYFFKLKAFKSNNPIITGWSRFFLFIGLSTLFGGTSHALFAVHSGIAYKMFWLSMQGLNGFAVFFAQHATLKSVLKNAKSRNTWKWSYLIQLALFIPTAIIVQNYLVTIIDNAIALIPIMILHFAGKPKERYYNWIAYGILISFITAFVHGIKFSLHAYFNYNDIAHVFIMMSLTVMFMGAKQKAISL